MFRSRRPLRPPRLLYVVLSALLTFVVVLALAMVLREPFLRWQHLRYFHHDDPAVRAEGWRFVAARADDDSALRVAAGELVRTLPIDQAKEVVGALQRAGVWGPNFQVGYIRWLGDMARGDQRSRAYVGVELAGVGMHGHPVMAHDDAAALVERLLGDEQSVVRFFALRAAAGLPPATATSLIGQHLDDPDPGVRRQARLLAEALGMPDVPTAAPASPEESTEQLLERMRQANLSVEDDSAVLTWRGILRVPLNDDARATLLALAQRRPERTAPDDGQTAAPSQADDEEDAGDETDDSEPPPAERLEKAEPLRAAAMSRVADHLPWAAVRDLPGFTQLAWVENTTPSRIAEADWDLFRLSPLMQAAAARAIGDQLSGEQWERLFEIEPAPARHLLLFAALDHLDDPALDELIDRLRLGFYDGQRMGAALLIGLRDSSATDDRLEAMRQRERIWLVERHIILAQLLRDGATDELNTQIDALLTRHPFPRTTALLVGMHAGSLDMLDEVLKPLGTGRQQVRATLDQYRFAFVLHRYLALDDLPEFDPYADGEWQAYQVDRLRAWYLVHRKHLRFDPEQRRFILDAPDE